MCIWSLCPQWSIFFDQRWSWFCLYVIFDSTGIWTLGFELAKQVLHLLSQTLSIFCPGCLRAEFSQIIFLRLLPNAIPMTSVAWMATIRGMSYHTHCTYILCLVSGAFGISNRYSIYDVLLHHPVCWLHNFWTAMLVSACIGSRWSHLSFSQHYLWSRVHTHVLKFSMVGLLHHGNGQMPLMKLFVAVKSLLALHCPPLGLTLWFQGNVQDEKCHEPCSKINTSNLQEQNINPSRDLQRAGPM